MHRSPNSTLTEAQYPQHHLQEQGYTHAKPVGGMVMGMGHCMPGTGATGQGYIWFGGCGTGHGAQQDQQGSGAGAHASTMFSPMVRPINVQDR